MERWRREKRMTLVMCCGIFMMSRSRLRHSSRLAATLPDSASSRHDDSVITFCIVRYGPSILINDLGPQEIFVIL